MKITIEDLKNTLQTRTSGVLSHGGHKAGCYVCAEELVALTLGIPWTDQVPGRRFLGGICRTLNDAAVWKSDASRTKTLLPLLPYLDEDGEANWIENFAMRMAREIIPTFWGDALLSREVEEWKSLSSPERAIPVIQATYDRLSSAAFQPQRGSFYGVAGGVYRMLSAMEELGLPHLRVSVYFQDWALYEINALISLLAHVFDEEVVVKEICKILLDFFAHKI